MNNELSTTENTGNLKIIRNPALNQYLTNFKSLKTIIMIKTIVQTETFKEQQEGFFYDLGILYSISKDCIITVGKRNVMVDQPTDGWFRQGCCDLIDPKVISEKEFKDGLAKTIDKINSLAGISNVPTLQLQEA